QPARPHRRHQALSGERDLRHAAATAGAREMNARPNHLQSPATRLALVLGAALGIAIAGCSVTRTSPVKDMYLLEPPLPTAAVAKTQPGTLRIDAFNVAAPYRSRSLVFRATDLRFEADFYNEFIVSPASNIADATARGLQQ